MSNVSRFGSAFKALKAAGTDVDDIMAIFPAVHPRRNELEAVKQISGFSDGGAVRVLALRERLVELRT